MLCAFGRYETLILLAQKHYSLVLSIYPLQHGASQLKLINQLFNYITKSRNENKIKLEKLRFLLNTPLHGARLAAMASMAKLDPLTVYMLFPTPPKHNILDE